MEKFVKDRFISFGLILVFLSGCASVQTPGYISRVDHPYDRKFYAGIEKVTSAFVYVLKKHGWTINSEADPAIYERDDRYDNNGYQNLLIMTNLKKQFPHLTLMRLNVFIHSIGNASEVEIRSSARNDPMAQSILDAVQNELSS